MKAKLELGATALAYAFLDGDWSEEGLVRRGGIVLGHRRSALRRLVRNVLTAYHRPPWDRVRELTSWLEANAGRDELIGRSVTDFTPRRWLPFQPAMGEMPWPVPAIPTQGELAHFFGLSVPELDWFADVRSIEQRVTDERLRHYSYRWVLKRSGGTRLIESPKLRLRGVQRHLLHAILDRIPPHPSAHGFVRGRSAISFSREHVSADLVLRLDLEDFFGSINAGRVYGVFRSAGYPEAIAYSLTGLTTNAMPLAVWQAAPHRARENFLLGKKLGQPHLPQGAPTSRARSCTTLRAMDWRVKIAAPMPASRNIWRAECPGRLA